MKLRKILMLATAITGLGWGSVALANYKEKSATLAPHATITFTPGSSFLTETDKTTLHRMIDDARAKGVIKQVTVAAWSDQQLPRIGEKLLDVDRDLATARANSIKDYLKTVMDVSAVEAYNMAESANWLARTFNTKDAELKSVFGKTGATAPVTKEAFQCIKEEGGPKMAVAVVEFDNSVSRVPLAPKAPITP